MSIESLKKSAKKLHRSIQEGKDLSLMQVQHLLAQSHGYSSWNEALAGEEPKKLLPGDVYQKLSAEDLQSLQEPLAVVNSKGEVLNHQVVAQDHMIRCVYSSDNSGTSLWMWKKIRRIIPKDTRCEACIRYEDDFFSSVFAYGDNQENDLWRVSDIYYDPQAELAGAFLKLLDMAQRYKIQKEVQSHEVTFSVSPEVHERLQQDEALQKQVRVLNAPREGYSST